MKKKSAGRRKPHRRIRLDDGKLLLHNDAAEYINVSRPTLYRLRRDRRNKIAWALNQGRVVYTRASLDSYMNRLVRP